MVALSRLSKFFGKYFIPKEEGGLRRYNVLRFKMIGLFGMVALVPLCLMALINFHIYKTSLEKEQRLSTLSLVNKTKYSFELYLNERLSAVSFIAATHSIEELSDTQNLRKIFHKAKEEFEGLVDLGLINSEGRQVAYAGPYNLLGNDYSEHDWFNETRVRGTYISSVFLGYRKLPHIAIAVESVSADGEPWVLRATIATEPFSKLISFMNLAPGVDAFLLNKNKVLQTESRLFGPVLGTVPFELPHAAYRGGNSVITTEQGNFSATYVNFMQPEFILMAMRPDTQGNGAWFSLRSDLLAVLIGGAVLITLVAFGLTNVLIRQLMMADECRANIMKEIEHTQKLSSIGRLAAGVAHEINNPLAVIKEKSGLMNDILARAPETELTGMLNRQIGGITSSVERCSVITHRLLGFARKVEPKKEWLDINEVVREVLEFLEKELTKRSISINLMLQEALSEIESDKGQLQQVFLNIVSNSLEAVEEGGVIYIESKTMEDGVKVIIGDNGCGMSEETMDRIFEPFFTTKRNAGNGLGLAISYGIIRKLGGDISVTSNVGTGSVFTITLPFSMEPKKA
ncbi:sensor histidine kinase [Halodesulfovibrio marinisediminis]|uniref:histidine kinase n=1 Tax=Halodesulfovibrio marinisediminis DSM 17456 TaxID=1121457 RepID=A0A1N6IGU1_9BACT|nr:PAS domain-containing sensor histidine kinase [Halodesulfovibrio marinisediminis]SIO31203.1 two-component system, NtrC family, sensor kinase [Halodesulfovibrio marinisediminis DSM 17456]